MTLLSIEPTRTRLHDHLLGASTAGVAGVVNVCSVIAFFSFATNVTGHVAVFAEELINGHVHQVTVVASWLALFAIGAGISGLSVYRGGRSTEKRLWVTLPLLLEIGLLAFVGWYGSTLYKETLRETEFLVAVLLLAMGLQNGLVASVSKGLVKTTHLTGLLTDIGVELALMLHRGQRQDATLRFKLTLHSLILGFYVVGGVIGGLMFYSIRFAAFYVASGVLVVVLLHDRLLSGVFAPRLSTGELGTRRQAHTQILSELKPNRT